MCFKASFIVRTLYFLKVSSVQTNLVTLRYLLFWCISIGYSHHTRLEPFWEIHFSAGKGILASTFWWYLKQNVLITNVLYHYYLSDRCWKKALLTNIRIRIVPCGDVELSADGHVVGVTAVVTHGSDNNFSDSLTNLAIVDFAKLGVILLKKIKEQIYLVFHCRKYNTLSLVTHNTSITLVDKCFLWTLKQ